MSTARTISSLLPAMPGKHQLLHILALVVLLAWYWNALGDIVVDLAIPGQNDLVNHRAVMLKDTGGTLSIDSIAQGPGRERFDREATPFRNPGITPGKLWIRVDLRGMYPRTSGQTVKRYLEVGRAQIDSAELYEIRHEAGQTRVLTHRSDLTTPIGEREVEYMTSVFPLEFDPEAPPEIYLCLQNRASLYSSLRLWEPGLFQHKVAVESTLYGVFFGGMVVLLLYNLFMYFSMREAVQAYYLGYLASITLIVAGDHGSGVVIFDAINPYYLKDVLLIAIAFTWFSIALFVREFLETRQRHPVIHQILGGVAALFIVAAPMQLILPYQVVDISLLMVSSLALTSLLTLGVYAVWAGNDNAKFFLLAWVFNIAGSAVQAGIIQGHFEPTLWTQAAMPTGILVEALLLSFSLADKIKRAQTIEREAKDRAISIARHYSDKLQHTVDERTAHLVTTQQQLVVEEKMAAMGVLTAGIAHEINNPNNFVSAGLQNIQAWRDNFEELIFDLIDEDAELEIKQMFRERFNKLNDHLRSIQRGSQRISGIVAGLRTITRLDESEQKLADVVDGLEQTIIFMRPTVGENIEIVTEFRDNPLMYCWAAELNTAFMAIISNATLAIGEKQAKIVGGHAGVIRVTGASIHDGNEAILVISFSDNGCGMTKSTQERAFEPFFTTRASGSAAGLGLATTQDTVAKHGGTITLASSVNEGTTVTIRLPIHTTQAD